MSRFALTLVLVLLLSACAGGTYDEPTFGWMGQHQDQPYGGSVDLATGASMPGWLASGMMEDSFWWHDSEVPVTDVTATTASAAP